MSVWDLNIIVRYLLSQFLHITEEDAWLYYDLYSIFKYQYIDKYERIY